MPDIELKPTEVRKSERVQPIVAVWWLFCCAFMFWIGLELSGYDWKVAFFCTFSGAFFGYLLGTRFRITLK